MAKRPEHIRSYTSLGGGVRSQLSELVDLLRNVSFTDVDSRVADLVAKGSALEQVYAAETSSSLDGASVLELGPGQGFGYMLYLAQKCAIVGVDLDVIPTGWAFPEYWRMLRANGPKRLLKTIGRRLLSRERAVNVALQRRLGAPDLRLPRVLQMDASDLTFPDGVFDFVYSFNFFEHVPQPRAALEEVRRVLRPGGVAYTNLHLFTCDSGFHDLRIIGNRHDGIAYWAHLRPRHQHEVTASAYLNELRLAEWQALFCEILPGSRFAYERDEHLCDTLRSIVSGGDLTAYSEDELLTRNVISIWQKPATR